MPDLIDFAANSQRGYSFCTEVVSCEVFTSSLKF